MLTGIIGLLLGSLITLGIVAIADSVHGAPAAKRVSPAVVAAVDRKYDDALFTCSVQTSESLTIDARTAILHIQGASIDGGVPGISRDIATCVVNALGATPATIDAITAHQAGVEKHTSRFKGLQLVWIGSDDGGISMIVSPTPAS